MTKMQMINKMKAHGWDVESLSEKGKISALKNGTEVIGTPQKVYYRIFGY